MRETRTSGSVRGVRSNPYPYRDHRGAAMDPVSEDFSVVVDGGEDVGGVETEPGVVAGREEYFGVNPVVEVGER